MFNSVDDRSTFQLLLRTLSDPSIQNAIKSCEVANGYFFKAEKDPIKQCKKADTYLQFYFALKSVSEDFKEAASSNRLRGLSIDLLDMKLYEHEGKKLEVSELRKKIERVEIEVFGHVLGKFQQALAEYDVKELLNKIAKNRPSSFLAQKQVMCELKLDFEKEINHAYGFFPLVKKIKIVRDLLTRLEEKTFFKVYKLLNDPATTISFKILGESKISTPVQPSTKPLEIPQPKVLVSIPTQPPIAVGPSQGAWKRKLNQLLAEQVTRGVSPLLEDNPDYLNEIVRKFFEIFKETPESEKKNVARTPLFPPESKLCSKNTRPLNYIFFTGQLEALNAIAPYLSREDWLERGPYDSTFVHCAIAGLEKLATRKGNVVGCIELILKKFPVLRMEKNEFGTSPEKYLKNTVMPKLQRNLNNLDSEGPWRPQIYSVHDCKDGTYLESGSDYRTALEEGKEILKLLEH